MDRRNEVSSEIKIQSNDWRKFNFNLGFNKEKFSFSHLCELYNENKKAVYFHNNISTDGKSLTVNPHLVFRCNNNHTCHVGTNDWNVNKSQLSNLSLGYWFREEKFSIGSDTSVDIRDNALNYVRLLCVLKLNDLKLVHESSLVNSARSLYDKNFILGSILDYSDKLKLFGNFAAELTQSNVSLAVGFQYALDDSTTIKGKLDNRYAVALSLLKSYRKLVDFGMIVRMSTVSKKTKQIRPKFNFGVSLNVADI
jgi:hypothetical protein